MSGGDDGAGRGAPGGGLVQKLRRRRLLQIALVYVGAAWLGVEIADFIVGTYGFSRKILDTVVLLAMLGFPAFLVIGWYHGERGPQRVRRGEAWLLLTLATLGAIGTYRIATAEPGAESTANVPGAASGGAVESGEVVVPASGPASGYSAEARADFGRGSVGVLPFRNNVPDAELEWLGAGLADLMTTNMAQLPGVVVIGRQSLHDALAEHGGSEEEEIPEGLALAVARDAGARMLLWGAVTGSADDMRIDAQLIEVESGAVAFAEFARGDDVFALVDTLTTRIAERLAGSRPERDLRIAHLGTRDLEALAAFHRGNALAREGRPEEADAHYARAIELDSAFTLPMLARRGAAETEGEESGPLGGVEQADRFARADAERGGTRWSERRIVQIYRRLPEELRERWRDLGEDDLRVVVDSLLAGHRSALGLLSGKSAPNR